MLGCVCGVDSYSQDGPTSRPGLSSQLCRDNKSSGQNCVANSKLVRVGLDFHSQDGPTSRPGLSSQLCRDNKSSGQNCVVNVKLFVRRIVC